MKIKRAGAWLRMKSMKNARGEECGGYGVIRTQGNVREKGQGAGGYSRVWQPGGKSRLQTATPSTGW